MSTHHNEPIADDERHPEITRSTDHPGVSNHGSETGLQKGFQLSAAGTIGYEGNAGQPPMDDPDEARESGSDRGPEGARD